MSSRLRKIKSGNQEVSLNKIISDPQKRIRLFFLVSGLVLLAWGFYLSRSSIPQTTNSSSTLPTTLDEIVSFSQEPVVVDKSFLSSQIDKRKAKEPPLRIILPGLGIDIPVKEAKVVKGYWEVFPDSAGFGLGSAYPDEIGNQVIFAHARDRLFLPLRNAKLGQNVIVLTKDKWYSYTITEIKEVLPSQTEVIAPTKDTVLTLYTCTGYADSKRLIVTAKPSLTP